MADLLNTSDYYHVTYPSAPSPAQSVSEADYCRQIAEFLRTNPSAWCKGVVAQGGDGSNMGSALNPFARAWCALGLVMRFTQNEDMFQRVVVRLSRVITPPNSVPIPVEIYNDQDATTLQDIIAMFDCAALLPRAFDEVKAQGDEVKIAGMATWWTTTYNSESNNLISLPPTPVSVEVATTSFADKAVESLLEQLASEQKKLVPWAKIMAQIKGEELAA